MRIFIPTAGRGPEAQHSYLKLWNWGYRVTLVCPTSEYDEFAMHDLDVVGCPAEGIGPTRQWILEHSDDNKVVMVDDDLKSWAVRNPSEISYRPATGTDIASGLRWLDDMLTGYAHAGIGPRLFSNVKPNVEFNGRMMRCVAYRKDIVLKYTQGFAFLMEDLEMTVQLIRMGFEGITTYEIVQDQPASNAPGGCSTYRNASAQRTAALAFHAWHKDFTRLTSKAPKAGWFGGEERTDIAIKWAKLVKVFQPGRIGDVGHAGESRDAI